MPERALHGLGCTAVNTVGVSRPRPCVRVFSWILGFTLGAHAVLLAHLWYASATSDPPRAGRLTMRPVRPVAVQREPAAAVPASTRTPAPAAPRRPTKAAAKAPIAQAAREAGRSRIADAFQRTLAGARRRVAWNTGDALR